MRPEPFFSGPGIDRADVLRADPSRVAELAQSGCARQLVWRDGLPAVGEDGRLEWQPVSEPALFLGLSVAAGFALARVGKTAMDGSQTTRTTSDMQPGQGQGLVDEAVAPYAPIPEV